jgi:putative DNA methylase
MSSVKRKLIEVAMPLEAINRESSREKAIRHGHPSTLHLWWARRPLAACRALIFAQLVDDPSSHPEDFPTEEIQAKERLRLFEIMERLVAWQNIKDDRLLAEAKIEIEKSVGKELPPIYDPFAGGGSIPLEAQRLGLPAFASDLNPVAVLLNKSLIEIPPQWNGRKPVYPGAIDEKLDWPSASGLAKDVVEYGNWVRSKALERISGIYPTVKSSSGIENQPIVWIWARTVRCPNPACQIIMPLVRTFWLSNKNNHVSWIKTSIKEKVVHFEISHDKSGPPLEGTVSKTGAVCIACATAVPLTYIRNEGREKRMRTSLMAVIADLETGRSYLSPDQEQTQAAQIMRPDNILETELPERALGFRVQAYGMTQHRDLFTDRQLFAMNTLSNLVKEAKVQIEKDSLNAGLNSIEADKYSTSVATYLGLAVGRCADYNSTICTWIIGGQTIRNTFARHAIPMTWDFAEANVLGEATGNWNGQIKWISKVLENLVPGNVGHVAQISATDVDYPKNVVVSTDPPYYDNIGYADLSDFFYVWLRNSLGALIPDLMGTVLTPKSEELIATPFRFGGSKAAAEKFFQDGFVKTFTRIRKSHNPDIPMTIFYAFKQSEEDDAGTASTGWETMLNGILESGFSINATWPIRTELGTRMLSSGTNALASSIILACRPKLVSAEAATRRSFLTALKSELPKALKELQQGNIAPVDLAQATIGPGMSIFSRYSQVLEADGSKMSVRTALAMINQVLDEVLSEQEGDFDSETRFCVKWFTQFGWGEGNAGEADVLSRAVNTSVSGLERGGIFRAIAGKAKLIQPDDLSLNWDPAHDKSISVWEVTLRVAHAVSTQGAAKAQEWFLASRGRVDMEAVKELSYLLFSVCEKRGWTETAILFNALGTSWLDISQSISSNSIPSIQETLDL